MAVWEYKVETGRGLMGQLEPKPEDILPYLNKLGDAGWELVVVLPLTEKRRICGFTSDLCRPIRAATISHHRAGPCS